MIESNQITDLPLAAMRHIGGIVMQNEKPWVRMFFQDVGAYGPRITAVPESYPMTD